MKVVVAGGSGFLGTALVNRLRDDGHEVQVLSRRPRREGEVAWTPDGSVGPWATSLTDADAIVNLAGESIGGGLWTASRKARIRDSRMHATRSLVTAIQQAGRRPGVFLSGSGMDYYGPHGDEPLTEDTPAGSGFLASVCRDWETEALRAAGTTRVVLLRTTLVLGRHGGVLPQIALPFKLFAGGPVGSGEQFYSWIHRDDWVNLVTWAISNSGLSGPVNLSSPNPVRNIEFAKILGRVLRRPAFMPAPAFALRLVLGEMAEELLLSGKRVFPAQAQQLGFEFSYPTLEPALRAIYSRTS